MAQDAKSILVVEVVEDEPAYQRALTEKLSREGFNVLNAKNGEEGLALALEKKPDLILLDLVMPKMDGMTMLRNLRAHNNWGKTVPVFILTNLSAADERRNKDITELEPTYYLEKMNTRIDELVLKIRDRLSS